MGSGRPGSVTAGGAFADGARAGAWRMGQGATDRSGDFAKATAVLVGPAQGGATAQKAIR